MGAQPVVTEDEVRVAVHVKLHEGCLLGEVAQDQAGGHRAACGPGTIGLPDRGRMSGGGWAAADGKPRSG